jgi:hypothetical protein
MINPHNTSDKDKTKTAILDWFNSSNNINIYLERNPNIDYETEGRIQSHEEAIHVDNLLKFQLFDNKIDYKSFKSSEDKVEKIIKYIKSKIEEKEG